MRSRTARVMMTSVRNGRDRRSENPFRATRGKNAAFVWDRSVDHIRASGHNGCIQRPDTWLHPNVSRRRQILLPCIAGAVHTWHGRALPAVPFGVCLPKSCGNWALGLDQSGPSPLTHSHVFPSGRCVSDSPLIATTVATPPQAPSGEEWLHGFLGQRAPFPGMKHN